MQKFTLNRRHITVIASYLFLTAFFFIIGYFAGIRNTETDSLREAVSSVGEVPHESASPYVIPPATYRVILEDSELRLYSDENGISRLISSEEISEDAYPVSDIASLKKGFSYNSIDDAVTLIENFIS